jgi:methyl-accepting chemotaxis protein
MSTDDRVERADELTAATRRLQEIATAIRDRDALPEQIEALAEEAARLAAEVAEGVGRDLRGGDG